MITILGADWCPACKKILKILQEKQLEHTYIQIPEGKKGWELVENMTGKKTIPQIFYHFGGSQDFYNALQNLNLNVGDFKL